MKRLLALFVVLAAAAMASDLDGNWKATADGPQGAMERTFTFKTDGGKVTGETTSTMMGKSAINDGKLDGDTVTFNITIDLGGNSMKVEYKGKVSGKEMKLTAQLAGGDGGGQAIEWKATKQ
jgi:hypothetical protein